ncbi:hypothetical protein PS833_06595 [Pseudomonas fluorescens]|uniref:Uncharacterized protein n=1 Tax=Pseudomonas fluorescens TaxID=294 RepID=A0A5E7G211_PSEFL|nr:hypothetical protein PS833_06595 [Pseudomonas fluorescens]
MGCGLVVGLGLQVKAFSWVMQGLRPPSLASQLLHDQRVQMDCGQRQILSPVYRWISKNAEPCRSRLAGEGVCMGDA